jgi:flagellar FliL protein
VKKIQIATVLCIALAGCGEKIKHEKLVGDWACIEDAANGEHPTLDMSFSSEGRFDWVIPSKVASITTKFSADYVIDDTIIKMPEIWLNTTGIENDPNPGPQRSSRSVEAEIEELTDSSLKMVWTTTSQKKVTGELIKYDCTRRLQKKGASTDEGKTSGSARSMAAITSTPATVDLEAFTVNLQPENGEQYLQTTITLNLNSKNNSDALTMRMAEVRNTILLTLSSKKASELSTPHGKRTLAKEIVEAINSLPNAGKLGVNDIFFTSFIIQ